VTTFVMPEVSVGSITEYRFNYDFSNRWLVATRWDLTPFGPWRGEFQTNYDLLVTPEAGHLLKSAAVATKFQRFPIVGKVGRILRGPSAVTSRSRMWATMPPGNAIFRKQRPHRRNGLSGIDTPIAFAR
jgi:hypothetical protein